MRMVFQYIKFLLKSTNQHGVHSPFVYDLVTKCFYNREHFTHYTEIKNYRKTLLKSTDSIFVSDLGARSRVMSSNKRKIHNIAKHAGTSYKRAKLLYRLMDYFKPKIVLELGTSLGIATHAMAIANKKTHVETIEGCANTSNYTKSIFNNLNIKNVIFKVGSFKEQLSKLDCKNYDLVFFDGHHDKEATINYFESLIDHTHNDSIFIFDDIFWSKGMIEAWEIIKQHPKVKVTIDTFFWGMVFFRKEQEKQHFSIRT